MANGDETYSSGVNDTDTLFFQLESGRASAAGLLDKHGPFIEEWPTGYRTLEFGQVGVAVAAAGALAVRAEAGIGGSEFTAASHRGAIGLTLQSTAMESGLASLTRGGGRIVTLAIATNLADTAARPSLSDALLDRSALSGTFGESVSDVATETSKTHTSATAGGWAEAGTRSGNMLLFVESNDMLQASEAALRGYLGRFYNTAPPTNPTLLLACAYGALAKRGNSLDKYPGDPSAKVWLGALVDCCRAIEAKLSPGQKLEGVLPPLCCQIYRDAVDRSVPGRPAGSDSNPATGISLPRKQRTVADAVRVGFQPGIPPVMASRSVINPGGGTEVEDLSYAGRQAGRVASSRNQTYLTILREHLAAYRDCRDRVTQAEQTHRSQRRRIEAGIAKAYQDMPHLRPENLEMIENDTEAFLQLLDGDGSAPPEDVLVSVADSSKGSSQEVWQNDLAVLLAVVGARRYASNTYLTNYRRLLKENLGFTREHVVRHLMANLGLLQHGGIGGLTPQELVQYGLQRGDTRLYEKLPGLLPHDRGEWYRLPQLTSPPVHILQLVADVINFKSDSVLPVSEGDLVKIRGARMSDMQMRQWEAGRGNLSRSQRKRLDLQSQRKEQEGAVHTRNVVLRAAQTYYARRYNCPSPGEQLMGVLAECDLAERQGFLQASPEEQFRVARRTYRIFNRIDRSQLPPAARPVYDRCLELANSQPADGGRFSRLFNDWAEWS